MATLRNKQKLAAVTRKTQEEHPRNGQSQNTSVPRTNEEYITQLSEEIEGRVTKNLSQEYSRTESRILGTLSKLDEFLLNQQIRMHSGTVLQTFWNINVENQGTNEDDSMSDPHPEAGLFRSQTTQNSGQEVGPYSLLQGSVRVIFGHHTRVGFCLWAIELARVMRKKPHFGMGIIWGAIPMSFPVFRISVSGRSLNSYGRSPNLWVQKKLVKFRQGTQDTWLRFAKFLREFLGYLPLFLLGDLGDVILG